MSQSRRQQATALPDRATHLVPLLIADVYEASGAFQRYADRLAGSLGQTGSRWRVLSAASVGERTVPQLARRLGFSRQAIQSTSDRLVMDGLAGFRSNPSKRRSPFVELTPAGVSCLGRLSWAARGHQELLGGLLEARALRTTIRTLRQMVTLYGRHLEAGVLDARPSERTVAAPKKRRVGPTAEVLAK